jgi:DNA helicase-2/ATP-dependent DNA helicase PcrA
MPVETFSKEEFEGALPVHKETGDPLWNSLGLKGGEYAYLVPVNGGRVAAEVRSSVKKNGVSAEAGADSIRCWLVDTQTGKPVGSKVSRWTTRQPGWQDRLTEVLRTLWQWRMRAGDCPKCDEPKGIWKVKKAGPNKDRPFAKCRQCDDGFVWLDEEPKREVHFASHNNSISGADEIQTSPVNIQSRDENSSAPLEEEGDSASVPTPVSDDQPSSSPFKLASKATCAFDDENENQDDEGEPVERDRSMVELNEYQQAVVDALAKGAQVIEACPGSGKTRTLESLVGALIESGVSPDVIGVFTFSNSAAAEARHRIALTLWPDISQRALDFITEPFEHKDAFGDGWLDKAPGRRMLVDWTCTIHALSFRLLKELTGQKFQVLSGKHQWEADSLIKDSLQEMDWEESPESVKAYIGFAIRRLVLPAKAQEFYSRLLAGTDVAWRSSNLAEIFRRYYDFCKARNLLDFDMMQARVVWLLRNDPSFKEKAQAKFEYILVDEAQDTSPQQAEILWTLAEGSGNVVFCGDVDQCVIEGELVLTPSGYVPVQEIEKYDKVIAAIGGGATQQKFVTEVTKQKKIATVVTITTENGSTLKVTHNHIVFASIAGKSHETKHHAPDIHYVYIMRKDSHGWRVGVTKNPRNRLNGEDADAMWIIGAHNDLAQALYQEKLTSFKYGIPTVTFKDHSAKSKREAASFLTQEWLDSLFSELDTQESIAELAAEEGFDFSQLPHIVPQNHGDRVSVRFDMCAYPPQPGKKRGRRSTGHLLSVETSSEQAIEKLTQAGFGLTEARTGGRRYRHSSTSAHEVELKAKQINEMLPGSLLIRGCFIKEKSYSLAPQAMPAGNVVEGFLVPVYDRETGSIVLNRVVTVEKKRCTVTTYDLEVMDVSNFVAGGIVVHNSMYAFRGAEPSVLRENFEAKWLDTARFNLPVNYRSTKAIIGTASQLIAYNYNGPDDSYLKPFESRPNAPDGEAISYSGLEMFADLCSETATLVAENPQDWFILSRTRAECAAIHLELVRRGIPAVNKSGGILFGAPHVRKVLAYARLACDYQDARDDLEILSEIANVATVEFRAPFTRRRHRDSCSNQKGWVDCGCPVIAEGDVDYSHTRFYGQKAVQDAGGWNGVLRQRGETNRGGYPTSRAKGASDLVRFVQRLEKLKDDAGACLGMIISDCILPWLEAEYGIDGADLAENGKAEDLSLLTSMVKEGQSMEQYLDEVENLVRGDSGQDTQKACTLGTIHWAKGRESECVILNATRLPIVPPIQRPGKLPMGKPPAVEEERRLAYVAVTRAKNQCVVIAASEWNGQPVEESRFVQEMGLSDPTNEELVQ